MAARLIRHVDSYCVRWLCMTVLQVELLLLFDKYILAKLIGCRSIIPVTGELRFVF